MNVLFLAPQPYFVPRGTPIAVRAAARAVVALGHRVEILTYHAGETVRDSGVRIRRIERPLGVRSVPIGPSWQKAVCDAHLARAAMRLAANGSYELVHAVEEAAFIAMAIKRRLGIPFVYDMDSLMSEQIRAKNPVLLPAAAAFAAMERRAVRAALGVLAVCPALVDDARRMHPDADVALLPDTPLNTGDEEPEPEIVAEGGVRAVYVGNLEPYQGLGLLLEAFTRVADDYPAAKLIVVGGGKPGAEARLLRRIPGSLWRSGRVRFLGPRPLERLGNILAAADILVSPRCAGRNTPMKLYSYLQSGRPVLATRLPTHTQVLTDDTAQLVAPSAPAMADGLRRLLASPDLRAALGRAGRDLAQREYGPEAFRRRMAEFYGRVGRRVERRCWGAARPVAELLAPRVRRTS